MGPYLTTRRGFLFSADCLEVIANIRFRRKHAARVPKNSCSMRTLRGSTRRHGQALHRPVSN